jgi:hypothetical protein
MKNIFIFSVAFSLMQIISSSFCYAQNANTSLSNLAATSVNQHVLPDANNKRNLGSFNKSWRALYLDSEIYIKDYLFIHNKGVENTFTGQTAGASVTKGYYNSAFGFQALYYDTAGICNSAFGRLALVNNSSSYNSAFGCNSLWSNTTGTGNTGMGYYTLNKNTTGSYNIAVGYAALFNNTTGEYNCALGYQSLYQNTAGSHNSAFGSSALYYSQASYNSAFGNGALANNTTGGYNTAVGAAALTVTGTGTYNTAIGYFSGPYITSGIGNTALGSNTLTYVNAQNYNTAVGFYAGYSRKGNHNTFVGAYADATDENYYNSTALGYEAYITASNQVRIGNYTVTTIGGQVSWTTWSDGRVKKNIKQNVPGLEFINKLNPVTYNLDLDAADKIVQTSPRKDKDGNSIKAPEEFIAARKAKQEIVYTGLIAQEVEKAAKKQAIISVALMLRRMTMTYMVYGTAIL